LSAQATASDKKGCIAAGKDAIDDGILFFTLWHYHQYLDLNGNGHEKRNYGFFDDFWAACRGAVTGG
jgi:hypothetical protein